MNKSPLRTSEKQDKFRVNVLLKCLYIQFHHLKEKFRYALTTNKASSSSDEYLKPNYGHINCIRLKYHHSLAPCQLN